MACRLGIGASRTALPPYHHSTPKPLLPLPHHLHLATFVAIRCKIRASSGRSSGESYIEMWKQATERKQRETEFESIVENQRDGGDEGEEEEEEEELERKSKEFEKILEVPRDVRDSVQRMQVIDRAAAAIAAARAVVKENQEWMMRNAEVNDGDAGLQTRNSYGRHSRSSGNETPGPDFWSWIPPAEDVTTLGGSTGFKNIPKPSIKANEVTPVIEKNRYADALTIPFKSKLQETNSLLHLPPFQSILDTGEPKEELGVNFAVHSAEAAEALDNVDQESSSYGINPDGSRWWKETGIEQRPDGVLCRWTLARGVAADGGVEWEDKYWEAADDIGYKELGSEKSGLDARGNVWHEYWKESMWQERGLLHVEKTADKWGKNEKGEEWQEKWREGYDASGRADKCAYKWCSIDPSTELDAGHAHTWHERWGENYDGLRGSVKYTDKWAERCQGDCWTKWGDKWDEHFDLNGHGVKQGETWWEGKHGERWNRTWGEKHNGTGWLHKYGKSSSGEHWDTLVQEDTWYEKYPHYGFMHCFENSVQLREVRRPSDTS
ncbi:hypothetical protein AKJ16_DCAP12355 [Drosera capensis]